MNNGITRNLEIAHKAVFDAFAINTPLRLSHWFAQPYTECKLVSKRESLYYTDVDRLRMIFKTPFLNKDDAFVCKYLRNSKKCANYVYANRGGNGNEASGDGYRLRGAGLYQHTTHDQFLQMSYDLGVDIYNNIDLLLDDYYAVLAGCWYWQVNSLHKYADADNIDAISDIVNIGRLTKKFGDSNGFEHRKEALVLMKKHFKV